MLCQWESTGKQYDKHYDKSCTDLELRIYSCSYTDICYPVADVSSVLGTQGSMCLPPHLRTERDPVSEMLCSLEYRAMDEVQKPSNPECYTPSSEPFRIYFFET
jgi:hypothetical protein